MTEIQIHHLNQQWMFMVSNNLSRKVHELQAHHPHLLKSVILAFSRILIEGDKLSGNKLAP